MPTKKPPVELNGYLYIDFAAFFVSTNFLYRADFTVFSGHDEIGLTKATFHRSTSLKMRDSLTRVVFSGPLSQQNKNWSDFYLFTTCTSMQTLTGKAMTQDGLLLSEYKLTNFKGQELYKF
mmetsp:Transcript_27619/g.34285  ORF Transcript_27619/g.34285 Transcript_27619/m.34285 type:complete len:121 (-) Transcript_27619:1834-2196(-)